MDTKAIIDMARGHLLDLPGRSFDVFNLARPDDLEEALSLAKLYKIVSKVSSLVGNLIEHDTIDYLNQFQEYHPHGKWVRQDPGFPDIVLQGSIEPAPGFEVKAWYPFSTEITGRFKDSQAAFMHDQTYVALLAWLPEHLIYGMPKLIDVLVTSAKSVAQARDRHYHNPPDYLVLEPGDTSQRTRNLQQTNTSGYKFQANQQAFLQAQGMVEGWGERFRAYLPTAEYQAQVRQLFQSFQYRLDTNYAKIDRIAHPDIEAFKNRVRAKVMYGMAIADWFKLLSSGDDGRIKQALERLMNP